MQTSQNQSQDPYSEASRSEKLRFEYQMAQDMLKHYDTLNWQIGSILIAGVLVLTGVVLNNDVFEIMSTKPTIGLILVLAIPFISFFVLGIWHLWFMRHRTLYNFRNEVFHRIEIEEGMFHYLRVVKAEKCGDPFLNEENRTLLEQAELKANPLNIPEFYSQSNLGRISGRYLSAILTVGIPLIQLIVLVGIRCAAQQ